MALAPSRSSFSIVVEFVFAASVTSIAAVTFDVAFDVAFDSAASVTSVAFVTSLFFDLLTVVGPIKPSP